MDNRRIRPVPFTHAAALIALAFTSAAIAPLRHTAAIPSWLDDYLTRVVRITAEQRRALVNGAAVTKLLDADDNTEVAVFGAIWIGAPMQRYVDAITDIERFERGGAFKTTRRISTPPALADFASLRLSDEDVKDLRTCRVGRCDVKLGEQALGRFRQIDWKKPDSRTAADALMRQLALEYVTGYLEGGNDRLAVYRDKSRPTLVAEEFRAMADRMPELTSHMPATRRYLLEYPRAALPGATSFLYWQETEFGLKPTIRISHLTIQPGPSDVVVTSKMLYATHYFWSGLELRVLLPDPARGEGFWFVTVNRSRSDGLSGFTGMFVRRRVRRQVEEGTLTALRSTKRLVERASAP